MRASESQVSTIYESNTKIIEENDSSEDAYDANISKTLEPSLRITPEHFKYLKTIGHGSYGHVYLVEHKATKVRYALKVLEKEHIIKYGKVSAVYRERDFGLELYGHPNIVKFLSSFQDEKNLYFLLEFTEMGSLSGMLQRIGKKVYIS